MTASAGSRAVRVGLGLAVHHPRVFAVGTLVWVAWWAAPAAAGLVLQAALDRIADGAPAGAYGPGALLGVLAAVEALRLGLLFGAYSAWSRWWASAHALLRTNLLAAQVASGGAEAARTAPDAAAAIPAFRDDADDLVEYVDTWVDLAGAACFGLVAVPVLLRTDALLTGVVVVPLVVVLGVTRLLAERVRRLRSDERAATAQVTGFLGGLFASVLAVKASGSEERAVARLRTLNAARRRTSLRDRLVTDTIDALSTSTVDVTIGLVLLVAVGRLRGDGLGVGDLALFTTYLVWLAELPRFVGIVLTRHRHAEVASQRMAELLPAGDATRAVTARDVRLARPSPPRPRPLAPPVTPPHLRLEGFAVRHADGSGVSGVDLDLAPGSFTVVTGRVGTGKSTLLRGLLGLVGSVEGTVRWDGHVVTDLARTMVPPRCAFVPQVPRLLSASLRDNLALGRAVADADLAAAVRGAALDDDLAAMGDGVATLLGPRGVRLSGGQLQRTATARALAHRPALLVCDDLSSALDAATERRLWTRLLDRGGPRPTVLVVSHRAAALARADQVVVLEAGRVTGSTTASRG